MKNKISIYLFTLFGFISINTIQAQGNIGINTNSPNHALEMVGIGDQYLRLHTTSTFNTSVEMELIRGNNGDPGQDWKLAKWGDDLRFFHSDDNFQTSGTEVMRLRNNRVGIGTTNPLTKLHITNGENASNSGDGYLMMGQQLGLNTVMDNNAIVSRNSGAPALLSIQSEGGNTYFGVTANTNTLIPEGTLTVGGFSTAAKLNIQDDLWQLQLNNWENSQNNWFIGASNESWLAGDDQLIFSPTSSSSDGVFRLRNVTDNNGDIAPVTLYTSADHVMLLDGNEIDTRSNPLYINYNSEHNIILNAQGGRVGMGTSNPARTLHVHTASGYDLILEHGSARWEVLANPDNNVYFFNNGLVRGYVHWNGGGDWVALSDRNFKENIKELENASEKIERISARRYNYIADVNKKEDFGFIAQELKEILPEAVFEEDGRNGVNYDQVTVLAIKGVQEQQIRLENLDSRLNELIESLEKKELNPLTLNN